MNKRLFTAFFAVNSLKTGEYGVYSPHIMRRLKPYIHQKADWPEFYWCHEDLIQYIGKVRNLQGRLVGKMLALGFDLQDEAFLNTTIFDVLKTSEIEGEFLNAEEVRSSIARRLGMDISGLVHSERDVDGIVEMTLDATQNFDCPLTAERLKSWHAALFPTGRTGMHKITVGEWRDDSDGPMVVISGALGKEKIHFEAPHSSKLNEEVDTFLEWFNTTTDILDPVIKAAIAHLWLVTIHPFEDGNGRITRAVTDMLLARSDGIPQRFYSMSSRIRKERKGYYKALEKSQQSTLDITYWISWFLDCLYHALLDSEEILQKVMQKHHFWNKHKDNFKNDRQKSMLNKLMDDFKGKLTTSKWAKMNKISKDTALRDIQDLLEKEMLQKEDAGGRSTSYVVNFER